MHADNIETTRFIGGPFKVTVASDNPERPYSAVGRNPQQRESGISSPGERQCGKFYRSGMREFMQGLMVGAQGIEPWTSPV
jgi:hypothetical protein